MSHKNELYRRIAGLISIKEFDKAIRICKNPEYNNDCIIQLQLMEIYYILKDHDEVIRIGTREIFQRVVGIQLKLVQSYLAIEEYDKALEICERPEFANHIGFMQMKGKILRNIRYKENNVASLDDKSLSKECKFLLYLMSLAKNTEDYKQSRSLYEEALILANSDYLKDDPTAIYKKVIILKRLNRFKEAYEIANESIYDDDIKMLIQRVSLLYKMGEYRKAMNLALDERIYHLDNVVELRKLIRECLQKENSKTIDMDEVNREAERDSKSILNDLGLMKNHAFNIESLNEYYAPQIYKDILLAAYYEINKYPISVIKKFIWELKNKYEYTDEYNKTINILASHLLGNNRIFDTAFYYNLLSNYSFGELTRQRILNNDKNA